MPDKSVKIDELIAFWVAAKLLAPVLSSNPFVDPQTTKGNDTQIICPTISPSTAIQEPANSLQQTNKIAQTNTENRPRQKTAKPSQSIVQSQPSNQKATVRK